MVAAMDVKASLRALRSPVARMVYCIGRAWQPRPKPHPARWCEENLQFPAEQSAHGGPFNLDEFAYWRPVFDWIVDPEVESIWLPGGTQIGKTSLEFAIIAYKAACDPSPGMFGGPDKEFIWDIRDKFYAMCEVSPALADLIPPEHKRNDRKLDLRWMLVHLAYSGNTQRLSGKACQFVIGDEADRWRQSLKEGSTQEKIKQRFTQFWRWLMIFTGTPTDADSFIWAGYEKSDRCTWRCPCPRCGHYQELRFFPHKTGPFAGLGGLAGLKGSDGAWLSPDQALHSAYYQCERGCRIDAIDKAAMIRRGVAVPKGCKVDKAGRVTGTPATVRSRGLHVPKIYAHKISWGKAAAAYLEAQGDPIKLQVFWNDWVGMPWIVQGTAPKWKQLARRLAGYHPRGTAPAGALFLTCGVDKQGGDCRWVVRAWGEGGTSWLVDYGIEPQQAGPNGEPIKGSDLEPLRARIVNRSFPLASPNVFGQRELRVRHMGVDSGAMKEIVRSFVKSFTGDRVLMLRGNTGLKGDPWAAFADEKDAKGKRDQTGLWRYDVNVDVFKEGLHSRWTYTADQPGAWWLLADPIKYAEPYLRELVNEGLVTRRHPKTKKMSRFWAVVDHRLGNHFFDCEVYNLFLAHLITGGDFANIAERFAPPRAAAVRSTAGDKPVGKITEETSFLAR